MKRQLEDEALAKKSDATLSELIPESFRTRHSAEFNEACNHVLNIDNSLLDVIIKSDFPLFLKEQEERNFEHYYNKLASAIISQQISGPAAKSIKKRLIDHFGGWFPHVKKMHEELSILKKRQEIRACGLSTRKMVYMDSLTNYFFDKEEEITKLFKEGTDDEIVDQLTKNIKGVGPWSAKMFLLTGLARMNVFSTDDLGIARGFSNHLSDKPLLLAELKRTRVTIKRSKIKHKKLNWVIYDNDLVESYAARFAPYRSLLMFILWRLGSTNVEAMAKTEEEFINN